jgi:hypothetical protein
VISPAIPRTAASVDCGPRDLRNACPRALAARGGIRLRAGQPGNGVKVRALLDAAGSPVDWTTEMWSSNHNGPAASARGLPDWICVTTWPEVGASPAAETLRVRAA